MFVVKKKPFWRSTDFQSKQQPTTTTTTTTKDLKFQFGDGEGARLRLEDVARQVGDVGEAQRDAHALLADARARLDFVGPLAAGVARRRHDDALLEERNVWGRGRGRGRGRGAGPKKGSGFHQFPDHTHTHTHTLLRIDSRWISIDSER